MPWPILNGFGILINPIIESPYVANDLEQSVTPPPVSNSFLLLNGSNFLLLSGGNLNLL